MEESQDLVRAGLRHVAELCTVAAITAPKSGGQLFLKGAKPFFEIRLVDDRETLIRPLAPWAVRG